MLLPIDATKEYMEKQVRLCSQPDMRCSKTNNQSALICFSGGLMEEAKRLVIADDENDTLDTLLVMISEAVQTGMIFAMHFPEWSILAVEDHRRWAQQDSGTYSSLGDEIERGLMQSFTLLHPMEHVNPEQDITKEKAENERRAVEA